MRNREHNRKGGLAAKKLAALKRKGGPGPLTANDLFGRIAASTDPEIIGKAQKILKEYRFEKAKNRSELAHKLSSIVQMYGEDAIKDLAMIHPDRLLIASTITETELKEVGNEIVKPAAPVEQTKQPQYHNACGACALGMFNCEGGGGCNCGCKGSGAAKMKNDAGTDKGVKEGETLKANKESDHTGLILGALALGLTIGVLATMAASPRNSHSAK